MPEQYVQDFTSASILYGDEWLRIQRISNGSWKDFKIKYDNVYGIPVRQATVSTTLAGLAVGQQLIGAQGAGTYIVPFAVFIGYKPGMVVDNQQPTVILTSNSNQVWQRKIFTGPNSFAACLFANTGVFCDLAEDEPITVQASWTPTGSGTIEVRAFYLVIEP